MCVLHAHAHKESTEQLQFHLHTYIYLTINSVFGAIDHLQYPEVEKMHRKKETVSV